MVEPNNYIFCLKRETRFDKLSIVYESKFQKLSSIFYNINSPEPYFNIYFSEKIKKLENLINLHDANHGEFDEVIILNEGSYFYARQNTNLGYVMICLTDQINVVEISSRYQKLSSEEIESFKKLLLINRIDKCNV